MAISNKSYLNYLLKQLYIKDPFSFCKDMWATFEPNDFIDHWLLHYYVDLFLWHSKHFLPDNVKQHWISEKEYQKKLAQIHKLFPKHKIVDVHNGKRHLSLNMPPRHTKSALFNKILPTWLAVVSKLQVATVSHVKDLSNEANSARQKILNSDEFKDVFGVIKLLENTKTKLFLDNQSELYSVSLSHMTGFGADLLILDDLINAEDAGKQQESYKTAMAFLQHSMYSRLNNPKTTGTIINIQQRLSVNDPTGYFLEKMPGMFNFVSIPAIFEDEGIIYVSPIDGSYQKFEKGDFLWPERFGDYSEQRTASGGTFSAQYLQKPSKTSIYVKEENFLFMNKYEASDIIENPEFIYMSHDFPIKDKKTSDFLGSVMAFYKDNKLLITDCFEQHMAYNASEKWVISHSENMPMLTQLVESKANGEIILQRLQGLIPGLLAFDPKQNSKGTRLEMAVSRMISKNVYFLLNEVNEPSPGIKMLINRLMEFPMVKNDDIVDAFTQLVIHVFEEQQFGIFTKSMTKHNTLESMPALLSRVDAAITREGQLYKFLKFTYDSPSDSLWILGEETFYATEYDAIQIINELKGGVRTIIDASDDNVLFHTFLGKIKGMINYTDSRLLKQKYIQIQMGIGARNIKWMPSCVEFKRDLAQCAYNKDALLNGIEKLATREGYVSCLRAAVYFYKGTSEFRVALN